MKIIEPWTPLSKYKALRNDVNKFKTHKALDGKSSDVSTKTQVLWPSKEGI